MMTLYAIAYKLNGERYEVVDMVVESEASPFAEKMMKHGYTVRFYNSMTLQKVAMLLLEEGPMKNGSDPLEGSLIRRLFPEACGACVGCE